MALLLSRPARETNAEANQMETQCAVAYLATSSPEVNEDKEFLVKLKVQNKKV